MTTQERIKLVEHSLEQMKLAAELEKKHGGYEWKLSGEVWHTNRGMSIPYQKLFGGQFYYVRPLPEHRKPEYRPVEGPEELRLGAVAGCSKNGSFIIGPVGWLRDCHGDGAKSYVRISDRNFEPGEALESATYIDTGLPVAVKVED